MNAFDKFLENFLYPLLAFAALCIFLTGQSRGADWTTETKVEETVYQALHIVDSAQTVYIADHPEQYYEKASAWAIGRHPSERTVIEYMAGDAILHVAVTAGLVKLNAPAWVTRTWELITIADSGHCVGNNFRIGIKVKL